MPFFAQEHVPIPTKDILSWICDGFNYDINKPVFINAADKSQSISAAQAWSIICKLVAGFKSAGLQAGDCVCLHSFNNIYYPVIVLGIIGAGGIFTGTNPSYTSFELKHHVENSKARFILSEPEILDTISNVAQDLGLPKSRILILDTANQSLPDGFESWRTLLTHGERDWVRFDGLGTSKNTTAMLLFSSGTTGLPKPAMLSHYNLVSQHTTVFEHRPRPYELSRIVALPMFHAATAPSTHISALRSGHANYIMRRFEVNSFLGNVEKYKVTDFIVVPPMVVSIVTSPYPNKIKALSSVRAALAGAAPLDKSMQARFQELLDPATPFTQIWGMTETSCFASLFYYPENDDTGSVGCFIPNIDVKLVDDEGKEITAYDVRGELCVRGPGVIRGYLDNAEANARDFDEDGFFHTGDILYCDSKSKLWYIVDRKKELIKVRGFQVAPAEIEGSLLDHPKIIDAAVIGIHSPSDGSELPRAYVVRKPGHEELSEDEVKSHITERLAKYKRLDGGVKFIDVIPKTPSGKILKRILREQAKREVGAKL
ncbi:AMP-binding enzyme [Glonium stellatum]|uniref:AMP-binding enzyme n=1 Tax=Glonium stellatum TaxID=574774 RepID=A0A8E2F3K1_9PEZI|nr:AMP-binding enzyme [Glonium stellatum]